MALTPEEKLEAVSFLRGQVEDLYARPLNSDPDVVSTKMGASLGVLAAMEVQRRTRNPLLVAFAALAGSVGAYYGSHDDNNRNQIRNNSW